MNKATYSGSGETQTVDTNKLREILGCGRKTAVEIGTAAGARIQIGKRVLWNVEKVRDYINTVSGV